jgi:putative membrane protein
MVMCVDDLDFRRHMRMVAGMEPTLAYLHYLAMILTGGFLIAEMAVCRPDLGPEQVRRLPVLDIVFFVAAMTTLVTGLLRLFFYAKGVAFYLPNPAFQVKMTLFVVIAGLSIRPTLLFIRWRRALAVTGALPAAAEVATARRLIHIELALLALIPLMAVLMARGIGR